MGNIRDEWFSVRLQEPEGQTQGAVGVMEYMSNWVNGRRKQIKTKGDGEKE